MATVFQGDDTRTAILVPMSEKDAVQQWWADVPTKMRDDFRIMIIPDELYKVADELIKSGEMEGLLQQGPEALAHRLKLGANAIKL